jgi:hypothetical protein
LRLARCWVRIPANVIAQIGHRDRSGGRIVCGA